MIIVLTGPPFAGKDTQGEILQKKTGLPLFSMGAIIREAYKAKDPKAIEGFEKYSLKGKHVPIELKFGLLADSMETAMDGFILSNFPATQEDLEKLNEYLMEHDLSVSIVFNIVILEEEMLARMKLRGREDDTQEIVDKRRENQDKDRKPVLDYYRKAGILSEIDGERHIGEVEEEILKVMKEKGLL